MTRYPGRWLVLAGYAVWACCLLLGLGHLLWELSSGPTRCELSPGSSIYGDSSRSWLPLGTTCAYDLGGYGRYVTHPSYVPTLVVVTAVVGLPLLRHLSRLLRVAAWRDAQVVA